MHLYQSYGDDKPLTDRISLKSHWVVHLQRSDVFNDENRNGKIMQIVSVAFFSTPKTHNLKNFAVFFRISLDDVCVKNFLSSVHFLPLTSRLAVLPWGWE